MHRSESKPSIREIAEALGVSHGTIHRDVNQEAAKRYAEQARKYKRRTPAAEREVTK
jgi:IS30 family transposase